LKRQKEQARQARAKEKTQRRAERQKDRANRPEGEEDPDIAGIVPGPQPKAEDEDEENPATD
jgi:hypothetical protein